MYCFDVRNIRVRLGQRLWLVKLKIGLHFLYIKPSVYESSGGYCHAGTIGESYYSRL